MLCRDHDQTQDTKFKKACVFCQEKAFFSFEPNVFLLLELQLASCSSVIEDMILADLLGLTFFAVCVWWPDSEQLVS